MRKNRPAAWLFKGFPMEGFSHGRLPEKQIGVAPHSKTHTMMQGPHRNGAGLFYAVQLPTYQFVDIDL